MSQFFDRLVANELGPYKLALRPIRRDLPPIPNATLESDVVEIRDRDYLYQHDLRLILGVRTWARRTEIQYVRDNQIRQLKREIYGEFEQLLLEAEAAVYTDDRTTALAKLGEAIKLVRS